MAAGSGVTYEIHGRVEDVLRVHQAIWRLEHDQRPKTAAVYNGPVFHISGDGAQLAWNNENVVQKRTEQVAPGFEGLAKAVATVLTRLTDAGLQPEDHREAEQTANEILAEVTKTEPDRGRIRRALSLLKGLLAPAATGAVTGVSEGIQELSKNLIAALGAPFGIG